MKSPLAEAGKRTAAACVGLLIILAAASCDTGTTAALPTPTETTAPPPATATAVATATQVAAAAPTDTQAPPASTETLTPAGAAGATPASTLSAQTGTANIKEVDFDFQPKVVTVSVGTKITWTNIGPTEHTVADSTLKLFSSNILNKGDTFSYTPTQPGTIHYLCTLHPDMVGTIVVVK